MKVCVGMSVFVLFFLPVADMLGFVLFSLKVCSEQMQSEFLPDITLETKPLECQLC